MNRSPSLEEQEQANGEVDENGDPIDNEEEDEDDSVFNL